MLVTGIHREELGFGDRVAARMESDGIDLMRIPDGVPQSCPNVDQQFYYETRQRELYLQLHQQVRGRYRLLIDLHSGVDDDGPVADVYCHEKSMLNALRNRMNDLPEVRMIRIVADEEPVPTGSRGGSGEVGARTFIPRAVWAGEDPLYVGLEIYLPTTEASPGAAERLAQKIIDAIRSCA